MTLESVFQQWASSVTWDSTASTPAAVIPASRNAAKTTTMKGYIVCDVTGVVQTDIEGGSRKEYPFKVRFVPGDGSPGLNTTGAGSYTLDMAAVDDAYASSSGGSEAVDGKYVPVNNGLMRHILSSDWIVGSAEVFESLRSSDTIMW